MTSTPLPARATENASLLEITAFVCLLADMFDAGIITLSDVTAQRYSASLTPDREHLAAATRVLAKRWLVPDHPALSARADALAAALLLDEGPELQGALAGMLTERGQRARRIVLAAPQQAASARPTGRAALAPDALWAVDRERLATLAARAIARGHRPAELLMVCIYVEGWPLLAERAMPGVDWTGYGARGQTAMARGALRRAETIELLSILVPDIVPRLRRGAPHGYLHAVICGELDGKAHASVYLLLPAQIGGVA